MSPVARYWLAIAGALVGAWLTAMWSMEALPFGAVVGALFGYVLGELRALRARLEAGETEIKRLRKLANGVRTPSSVATETPGPAEPAATASIASAALPVIPAIMVERLEEARALAPPDPPASQPEPPAPGVEKPLLATIRRFFTGGNTLVRAGVVVLFFGVAFLLRYVAEHSHVPVELRLSGVALSAVALLVLGWRLRTRRAGYGFALQGGGVGILYLTVFAALRLYAVLPPALGFAVLVAIAMLSAALAVLQDSQAFALLGAIGGFLAPLLASSGQGSHVMLFSYFLVLNAGIVAMAWFKSWRPLNLCGFLFTFAIASGFGVLRYRADLFASTEPFLVVFFLFYVGVGVLFSLRQPINMRGYVDGTLLFGTPIAAFGLQTAMLHQDPLALAYSALAVSAVYLLIAWALHRRAAAEQRVLLEACLALGVVFLTLAIPLALGNRLNSAAWALEGAGLVWVGCRQARRLARASGTLLVTAAALLLLGEISLKGAYWLLPPGSYAGIVLASVAGVFGALTLYRARPSLRPFEALYAPWLFVVGVACWCLGSLGELPHGVTLPFQPAAGLALLSLTALLLSELSRRLNFSYPARASLGLLGMLYAFACIDAVDLSHPFASAGYVSWPLAFAIHYLILRRHEGVLRPAATTCWHVLGALLGCAVLGSELAWQILHTLGLRADWPDIGRLLPAALLLLFLPRRVQGPAWPFAPHRAAYAGRLGPILAVLLGLWTLLANLQYEGRSDPLPYVPLLNPLDLTQLLVFIALWRFWRHVAQRDPRDALMLPPAAAPAVLALLGFVWCNGMLLRTLHHWLAIPMNPTALLASTVVQTSLTIFWSVLSLITMLLASLRHHRIAWLSGAGLLVVVIAKLFLVDLSSIGSIARIVSFVGVGVLMLVIGYFSPLPPRPREAS